MTDDVLRQLLRDNSVEGAANRYFDQAHNPAQRPPQSAAAAASTSGKRAAAAPSREAKHQRLSGADVPSGPTAVGAPPAAKASAAATKPLAERMRPSQLDELLGQGDALDAVLRSALANDRLPSLILWGPPGCGKTSFAACVAGATRRIFRSLSAAKSGVASIDARAAAKLTFPLLRLRCSATGASIRLPKQINQPCIPGGGDSNGAPMMLLRGPIVPFIIYTGYIMIADVCIGL